jgi:hypothetical protein
MAARNPQSMAKRAREQALREKRERKREKKADAAASRAAAQDAETRTDGQEAEPGEEAADDVEVDPDR